MDLRFCISNRLPGDDASAYSSKDVEEQPAPCASLGDARISSAQNPHLLPYQA